MEIIEFSDETMAFSEIPWVVLDWKNRFVNMYDEEAVFHLHIVTRSQIKIESKIIKWWALKMRRFQTVLCDEVNDGGKKVAVIYTDQSVI